MPSPFVLSSLHPLRAREEVVRDLDIVFFLSPFPVLSLFLFLNFLVLSLFACSLFPLHSSAMGAAQDGHASPFAFVERWRFDWGKLRHSWYWCVSFVTASLFACPSVFCVLIEKVWVCEWARETAMHRHSPSWRDGVYSFLFLFVFSYGFVFFQALAESSCRLLLIMLLFAVVKFITQVFVPPRPSLIHLHHHPTIHKPAIRPSQTQISPRLLVLHICKCWDRVMQSIHEMGIYWQSRSVCVFLWISVFFCFCNVCLLAFSVSLFLLSLFVFNWVLFRHCIRTTTSLIQIHSHDAFFLPCSFCLL